MQADVTVRRARLAAQRLTDTTRLGADPAAVARAVCGIQAQDMRAAQLALRVRSNGLTAAAVDEAVAGVRSVVRTWLMRGTLHLVACEDVRWMLRLLGPLIDARDETRRGQLGLDAALCKRGVAAMRKLLSGGPMTRPQLREQLRARGLPIAATGQAMIHLVAHAAHLGVVCYGPPQGRQSTLVLFDDWVPQAGGPRGSAALAELATRYMVGYGPATVKDFAAWSSLPAAQARAGMAAIGAELDEVPSPWGALWTLGAKPAGETGSGERSSPTVRLLPSWDTYTLGYQRRDSMLEPRHANRFQAGGLFYPSVCVDGRLHGVWRIDNARHELVIEISPFDATPAATRKSLNAEVAAIGLFLGRPARWTSPSDVDHPRLGPAATGRR